MLNCHAIITLISGVQLNYRFIVLVLTLSLAENRHIGSHLDASGQKSLVEKYLEFKLLMLKIDPAEEGDEEERLASAMRTYQVTESPVSNELSTVSISATKVISSSAMTPAKSRKSSSSNKGHRSPRSDKSSSKKKSHRKRKRKTESDDSSDDSDCDPDFRA